MNKQQLIKEIHKIVGEHCFDKLQVQDGWFNWLWLEKQINELDEPSREECDYFTAPYNYGESTDIDYNICNICRYHEKCDDKFKSNFDVWNYCPNCGAKIKREKKDE